MYYKTIRALPSSAAHHPPLTTIHRPTRYLDTPPHELPSTSCVDRRQQRSIDVADALLDERPELRWQTDPAAYDRMVRERHERWDDRRRREYETLDAADLARQERYGSDPVNDDG
jgi:hypothetical protein